MLTGGESAKKTDG